MSALDYISNDYARGYVHSRAHARKGVFVSLEFIDLCDGNLYDAILFSQIMYWHEPSDKTGETKMRRELNGHLWVAKNHSDWYDECRIKAPTARKSLDRLKEQGLIIYELHGEKGNKTPFIRINWDVFEAKMKAIEADKKVIPIPVTKEQTPVTVGQGGCPEIAVPLLQEGEPNTENTTENTQTTTTAAQSIETPQALESSIVVPVEEKEPLNLNFVKVKEMLEAAISGTFTSQDLQLLKEDSLSYSLDHWHEAIETYKRNRETKLAHHEGNIIQPYKYILAVLKNMKAEQDSAQQRATAAAQLNIQRTIEQVEKLEQLELEIKAQRAAQKAKEGESDDSDQSQQRAS